MPRLLSSLSQEFSQLEQEVEGMKLFWSVFTVGALGGQEPIHRTHRKQHASSPALLPEAWATQTPRLLLQKASLAGATAVVVPGVGCGVFKNEPGF